MSVDLSVENGLAEIVLNRPDKMNALNDAMVAELNGALERAAAQGARAMMIRGEGPAFSAGRDLADAHPGDEDAEAIIESIFNPLIKRIVAFPAPTFAAAHGACLGVGLGLALGCDVTYVAEDAKIGSPFARIGAVLDSGGHSFFVSRLGAHRALELIYTGRLLSGVEAAQLAQGPTAAFMQSKRLVRRIDEEAIGLFAVLKCEAQAQGAAGKTADYKEGISAFQQKRAPKFIGK